MKKKHIDLIKKKSQHLYMIEMAKVNNVYMEIWKQNQA